MTAVYFEPETETPSDWQGRAGAGTVTEAATRSVGVAATSPTRPTFEQAVLPELDFLYRMALRLTRDPSRAEDLVQETILRALRGWSRFRPVAPVGAWLATILRNEFISERRRAKRRGDTGPAPAARAQRPDAARNDSEREIIGRLVEDEVIATIQALPTLYREPLLLSYVEGRPHPEIAAITGLPLGTVKSRIFRARAVLRGRLRAYAVAARVGEPAARSTIGANCNLPRSASHQSTHPPKENAS